MATIGIGSEPVTQDSILLAKTKEGVENCKIGNDATYDSSEDIISPLQKTGDVDFPTSHTRKRSVLKKEDRPKGAATERKRVSFSSGPSERRVSNGEFFQI